VLLLAILEVSPTTHASIDVQERSRRSAVLANLVWRGAVFMALVSVGMVTLGPLQLMLGLGGTRSKEE